MSNRTNLSDNKRDLLEKYVRDKLAQAPKDENRISPREPGSIIPLSFGQQQMWLLNQLTPHIPVYNECVTIHLPGPLDEEALERSFNEIIRRHEAWRTSFPIVDRVPVQKVYPPSTIRLPVTDLRHIPESEREAEALRLATEQANILFDLSEGPLLRTLLIRLKDEEHRLFLVLHHIIFDGASIYQIFLSELYTLYEAFSTGQPSPLSPPLLQYADYAAWQTKQLKQEVFEKQLAYWQQQLAMAPTALALPTDRPRPPGQTYRGSTHLFVLTKDLTDALKAISRQEEVTFYMTMVAAFNTLLYRYTGQDDLLIGTASTTRKRPELEKLMGYFLNTLVLRTNLAGNPTFRNLLAQVREVISLAITNDDIPFEYLVKELQIKRDSSLNPLFQACITLVPSSPALPSQWTLTQMDVTVGTSKFDLTLELDDRPEGLVGRFEYNTDLFDATTIERMVKHWQMLLASIANNPAQHLNELQILPDEERHQLLLQRNETHQAYPDTACIHQLFERQVEQRPGAIALMHDDYHLTYRELNQRANQLASYLQDLGVGPEVLVGLCVERSVEMVVGLLAVLKAGGAYVPLDPAYPAERLAFILQDSQVAVLLTQERLRTQMPAHSARLVCLDTEWERIAEYSETNVQSGVKAKNLAYVIYTSGSTGNPKGVLIEHHSTSNFLCWIQQVFSSQELSGVLASTSICFDLSIFELFGPLSRGGKVILVENALQLPGLTVRREVTLINTVPSVMAQLLKLDGLPSEVSLVNLAGESLQMELVQQIYQQSSVQRVFNLYGPSETTTYSTYARIEKDAPGEPTIGRPIANTQVYVLDQCSQPVPIGVPGELSIGGAGVARGYLRRPELTAERFVINPFSDEPNAHLYKTGDLVRYLPDGTLEFLGRLDHQVKIHGFRIELGEIEAVLREHEAVQQAVAMVREDVPGDKRLVAYVVPSLKQETSGLAAQIRNWLQEQVPRYMVPAAFVLLDAFPLNHNGKIDRRALAQLEPGKQAITRIFVAPTLPIHHQLIQIWEEMLGVHPIGIKDDFFELGGHSLLAALMFSRVAQVYGKKLPLSLFFTGATIERMASALLEDRKSASQTELQVTVVPVQVSGYKRPFFYLHGDYIYGAFYCSVLARLLGPEQPFYVLEPYKFDAQRSFPSFEKVAAAYVQSLRAVQPEGPYFLGGWCAGGLVAHEIARQLRAEGQKVALLVLMDPAISTKRDRSLRSFAEGIGKLLRWKPDKRLDFYMRIIHIPRYVRRPSYRQSRNAAPGSMSDPFPFGQLSGDKRFHFSKLFPSADVLRQDNEILSEWLISGHVPGKYCGKITFFWTEEEPERKSAWEKMVRTEKAELHIIPGTHHTARTDYLGVLAKNLRQCLNEAEETASTEKEEGR